MPADEVLTSELEPLMAFGQTVAAVAVAVTAYLTAKLRFGWWRPRRPRR